MVFAVSQDTHQPEHMDRLTGLLNRLTDLRGNAVHIYIYEHLDPVVQSLQSCYLTRG